jgi:predicted nucleic acid-binding protein
LNYLDTSALIKRFVAEKGSPLIQTIVTRKGPVSTAKIAYAEVYAGLTRKHTVKANFLTACMPCRAASLKAIGRHTFE